MGGTHFKIPEFFFTCSANFPIPTDVSGRMWIRGYKYAHLLKEKKKTALEITEIFENIFLY